MADVKWIKLSTGFPDSRKIKQIRKLPDGDTIALMWVFLMCLAGDTNEDGMVYFTPEIPYTEEMLSDQFDMEINTVRLGLATFQRFGMVEIVDEIICLSSWEKWQSTESLANIREQTRKRVAKHRAKQKQLASNVTCNVTVTECNATEEDKEEEREEEREKDKKIDYNSIKDAYNTLCPSLPSVKTLSEARKKAIRARLNTYDIETLIEAFKIAEASDFLKGRNNSNWTANFDWIIKDANLAKILDGNYNNKPGSNNNAPTNKTAQQLDDFYNMAARWAEKD